MTKLLLRLLVLIVFPSMMAAQKRTAPELIALAQAHSAELRSAIEASFDAKDLKEGTAWLGVRTGVRLCGRVGIRADAEG